MSTSQGRRMPGSTDSKKEVATRFPEHGIELVAAFTDAESGSLICITRFSDEDSRKKAWRSFDNDGRWKSAKAASEVDGPLLTGMRKILLNPVITGLPLA